MSILNVHDINRNVDEGILMKTLEGREQVLKEDFKDFLNQFRGLPINDNTLHQISWEFDKFMTHVTCKFAFNCQLRNLELNRTGIVPIITGTFEYARPMSLTYTPLNFSIA